MKISMLHFDPRPGDWRANLALLRAGIERAGRDGADWIITPELAMSGYSFCARQGLDWIDDSYAIALAELGELAARMGAVLFLGGPERATGSDQLFNSLYVFDGAHGLIGTHRKVNTLKVGSEACSSPGAEATVLPLAGFGAIGLLVCADAFSIQHAEEQAGRGARAIVSIANWAPGQWGPSGEWESISAATGLPVFVCNRTGREDDMDFQDAESMVAWQGARVVSFASEQPSIITLDWSFSENRLLHCQNSAMTD